MPCAGQCHKPPYCDRAAYQNEQCKAEYVPMFSSWFGPDIKRCKQRCKKHQCHRGDSGPAKRCNSGPADARRVEQ